MTAAVWTCPFCPLHCDHATVHAGAAGALQLQGADCPRAQASLATLSGAAGPVACIDGHDAGLAEALEAAAARLAAARLPLMAGLGTDVAGARALYPLACALGAICDGDAALWHTLRPLQDRGRYTATLAEVSTRADALLFLDGLPRDEAPLFAQRLGLEPLSGAAPRPRWVAVLGARAGDEATLAQWRALGHEVQSLPLHEGDLFATLALLHAPPPGSAWAALAQRLQAARCAVLVGTPSRLPAQGALVVEAADRLVNRLNERTRAAVLWLGASTANTAFAWLSGLPLRSRAGARAEHEPWLYNGARLVAERAVDALLWVQAFAPTPPPASDLPTVVLGPAALAAACRRAGCVFIAVATPGVDAAGHLFRTDGTVLMPLHAARASARPGVAGVARALLARVQAFDRAATPAAA